MSFLDWVKSESQGLQRTIIANLHWNSNLTTPIKWKWFYPEQTEQNHSRFSFRFIV